MGNLVIATPALSDAATLTAGSEASTMPASNLQTMQPGEVWRATDLSSAYVVADLGSAKTINLVSLIATNASSLATWRVRAAASVADLTASPGYDSDSMDHWPTTGLDTWDRTSAFLWLGSSAKTYRYWRIDVSDVDNADGFYEVGRLYIASAWQPTRNLAYGWQLGFVTDEPRQRSAGGQTYPLQGARLRFLDLTIPFLGETEMVANGFELDRLRGTSKDILVIRDPDTAAQLQQQSVYGLMSELPAIVNSAFRIFEKRFHIEELLP